MFQCLSTFKDEISEKRKRSVRCRDPKIQYVLLKEELLFWCYKVLFKVLTEHFTWATFAPESVLE